MWVRVFLVMLVVIFTTSPSLADLTMISEPPGARKLIIFVHGWWGGKETSFTAGDGFKSWPDMIKSDINSQFGEPSLSTYAIAFYNYPKSFRIPAIVTDFESALEGNRIANRFDDIIFVAHSEGGLIVKRLLIDAKSNNHDIYKRVRAFFAIATPSRGSWYADFASHFSFFAGPQPSAMTPISNNDLLIALDTDWNRLMRGRQAMTPAVYCAYESEGTIIDGVTTPFKIVDIGDVDTNCDDDAFALEGDHLTVAEPKTTSDKQYRWVREKLAKLATAKPKLREFRDNGCPGGCPEMVQLPRGSFAMGSTAEDIVSLIKQHHTEDKYEIFAEEYPPHEVTIDYDVAVGKYDITRDQFGVFVTTTRYPVSKTCQLWSKSNKTSDYDWHTLPGSYEKPGFDQAPDKVGKSHPVVCISWDDAKKYIDWLNQVTGHTSGPRYRLLSEAEWEYAARAGTSTAYYWGPDIGKGNNHATCSGCGSPGDGDHTSPVGTFASNRFGLYDMSGNVWQMVEDAWYDGYDESSPADGKPR